MAGALAPHDRLAMVRLLLFLLFALAAWQGSKHYREVLDPPKRQSVVIENQLPVAVERVRVVVAGQTQVRERIEAGSTATLDFPLGPQGPIKLIWGRADRTLDSEWQGGRAGPGAERHTLTLSGENRVVHRATPLATHARR